MVGLIRHCKKQKQLPLLGNAIILDHRVPMVSTSGIKKKIVNLGNEFDFWKVHGIMNTSGLLQETRSIHDSMNISKMEFNTYIYILF